MKHKKYLLVLIIPLAIAGLTTIVMLLWDAVIPDLFGSKSISFWQAMGLLLLCKILFGGFHCKGHGKHKHGHRKKSCRDNYFENWKQQCKKHKEENSGSSENKHE